MRLIVLMLGLSICVQVLDQLATLSIGNLAMLRLMRKVEILWRNSSHSIIFEVIRPATEGAVAPALEALAGKVWQQLEGRLAAWVQDAFPTCAIVSTDLASEHDDVKSDSKESEAAGQADICPHIKHARPVEALKAKLTTSVITMQILRAVDTELLKGPMSTKVCQDALYSLLSYKLVLMGCSRLCIY